MPETKENTRVTPLGMVGRRKLDWIYGAMGASTGFMWLFGHGSGVGMATAFASPGCWFILNCWLASAAGRWVLPAPPVRPLRLMGGLAALLAGLQLVFIAPGLVWLVADHLAPFRSYFQFAWALMALEGVWLALGGSVVAACCLKIYGQPVWSTLRWLAPRSLVASPSLAAVTYLLAQLFVRNEEMSIHPFILSIVLSFSALGAVFAIAVGRAIWRVDGSVGSPEGAIT